MKFSKAAFFLFIPLVFSACRKPDIYIPLNDNPGVTGINNLSQVYVFFKTREGDTLADMHKNQIISSTHYVVHIDRRLPLHTLINHLEWLHQKRHKKTIHYRPGFHLYFSHIDTVNRVMRLNPFDSLEVLSPFYDSRSYAAKYPKTYGRMRVLHLDYDGDTLRVDTLAFPYPGAKARIREAVYALCPEGAPCLMFLNADYRMTYDRYNALYGFLVNLDSTRVRLAHKQFWYNPAELKRR
ncbi:MAG: hypothetical protein GXO27_07210 [Chlorobi bacterium]|nr:hypothetical protein [Chlorobiota bacterium]